MRRTIEELASVPATAAGRRYRRMGFWSLVLMSAVLVAGPAGGEFKKGDPGEVVEFKLERGRILEPLPFDVHFFLMTPVPAGWPDDAELRATLIPSGRRGDACSDDTVETPGTLRVDELCPDFPLRKKDPCKLAVKKVQAPVDGSGTAVQQFEIHVPPLTVKRDYCLGIFMLRAPDDEELEAMTNALMGEMETVVRQVEAGVVLTGPQLTNFCRRLDTAIDGALAGSGLEAIPAEGSVAARCGAGDLAFGEIVLGDAVDSYQTALRRAVRDLRNIALAIPEGATAPILVEIEGLDTQAAVRGHLLGLDPGEEAIPTTAEVADARHERVLGLKRELEALSSDPCPEDPDVLLGSPPELRLACFARDNLAELEGDLDSLAQTLGRSDADRRRFLAGRARQLAADYDLAATTWDGFEGRFQWYVTADEGVAHAWDLGKTFSYTGANFYTMPVNKRAPLSTFTLSQSWRRRFAFVVGVSNSKIDVPGIEPHFEDRFLLLGAGLRLTDHLRFAAGVVLFDEVDPDPLVDAKRDEAHSPFASLSLDVDVVSLFQKLFVPDDG